MKIGLIDVDGHNYPNLPLMKLSAWHKAQGNSVEWYDPLLGGWYDRVYMSKVFSFSPDYAYPLNSREVVRGGSGYCISLEDGVERYDTSKDLWLPQEIEHIYPDYSLYGINDTAYGFMPRGCPRGCKFCHVGAKEGLKAVKVADLNEFWRGQPNIVLMDPNATACEEWGAITEQLQDSNASVEFNQGLDVRLLTERKIEDLNKIKLVSLHLAWDNYQDKEKVLPRFELVAQNLKINARQISVYVLCNFNTNFEQDLERAMLLRKLGFSPYIALYNRQGIPKGHRLRKLQRWVNNRYIFWACDSFEDYQNKEQP